MSVEKSILKRDTIQEVGSKVDDLLENAVNSVSEQEGSAAGIRLVGEKILALCEEVDKEIDEEKLDIEQAKLAKRWLIRAVGVCESYATLADKAVLKAQGRQEAYQKAIGEIKKLWTVQNGKVNLVAELLSQTDIPSDGHPGPGLAAQRKAESAKEAQAKKPAKKAAKKSKTKKKAKAKGK